MNRQRTILHADMDAFYASVEQRDHPELRGRPVIVGGQGPRGVVSAASYEARKFGVRSAMPGFRARELCPDGVFLSGDMKKYGRESERIHEVFREFTDQIEPLALDEAFLDITGSLGLFGPPEKLGQKLKKRVKEMTGLVVSVGIAPSKLVAKIACARGKPDGLLVIDADSVQAFLAPMNVRALWGIGPKAALLLNQAGIVTLSDLVATNAQRLKGILGDQAESIRKRALGDDEREVVVSREQKSIGEEATFTDNVTDHERIMNALISHSETVAARARRSGFQGRTVSLKVKLSRRKAWGDKVVSNHELFPVISRQVRLSAPTSDGLLIVEAVRNLWQKLKLDEPIRLIGVSLSDLTKETAVQQLDLFSAPAPKALPKEGSSSPFQEKRGRNLTKGDALGKTMDAISSRFGESAIVRGAPAMEKITPGNTRKLGTAPEPDD